MRILRVVPIRPEGWWERRWGDVKWVWSNAVWRLICRRRGFHRPRFPETIGGPCRLCRFPT